MQAATRSCQKLFERLLAAGVAASAEPPAAIAAWAEDAFELSLRDATAEWSDEELYLSAPGPGRDAWVSIDRASGAAKFEKTDRGWLAYFNDLHKGRNTGIIWTIFIDVVAVAVLFFSLTGLVLLWIQARQRTSTWPLVGGGHRPGHGAHDFLRTLNGAQNDSNRPASR